MIKLTLFLLVVSFSAMAGTGAIPSGENIKLLKDNLRYKSTDTKIMASSSDDPTVIAKDAEIGSLYIQLSTGTLYQKQDSGSSTNWLPIPIAPSGSGTDNHLVRWDGTGSPVLQDSSVDVTDTGAMSGVTQLDVDNIQIDGNTIISTDTNGDINLTPDGAGEVVAATLEVTDLSDDVLIRADGANGLVSSGVGLSATDEITAVTRLEVDNLALDGNSLVSTDTDGNIGLDPNGVGSVLLPDLAASRPLKLDGSNGIISELIDLTSSNDITGILPVANGGTGVDSSSAANGQLLIGNGSGFSLGTITGTANQVVVTNGSGSVTLSTPQDIATSSSPEFSGLTVSGLTASQFVVTDGSSALASQEFIDLSSDIAGVLPLANGGTENNLTAVNGGIVYTDADSMEISAAGTSGQALISGGAGSPTWFNPSDTEVLYSNSGALASESAFTYTAATDTLDVGTLQLDGSTPTIVSTGTNEDLILDANGTGVINLETSLELADVATATTPPSGELALHNDSEILKVTNDNGVKTQVAQILERDRLTNPSFELSYAGDPDLGWTYTPSGADVAEVESSVLVHGVQAVKITPSSESFTFEQTFSANQFDTNLVGFTSWVKADFDFEICFVQGTSDTMCVTYDTSEYGGAWKEIVTFGTVTSGTNIGINFKSDSTVSGTAYFDKVEFTSSPLRKVSLENEVQYVSAYDGGTYGSTDTKIPIFTTIQANEGPNIVTIGNTAANGFTITANRDCYIYGSYSDNSTVATYLGWSLNSSQLTTNIQSINAADRLSIGYESLATAADEAAVAVKLNAGDVLRPHGEGNTSGTRRRLTIVAVAPAEYTVVPGRNSYQKVRFDTANGYGSTDTKIYRFTNETTNGSGIFETANTAANGVSVTMLSDAMVFVVFNAHSTTDGIFGAMSLNSSSLTTSYNSLSVGEKLGSDFARGTSSISNSSATFVGMLSAGDVIRPHGDASTAYTAANMTFEVVAIRTDLPFNVALPPFTYSASVSDAEAITESDGFVSSCTDADPSVCTLVSGFFSEAPRCWAEPTIAGEIAAVTADTSSSVTIDRTDSGTSFKLFCLGRR